MTEIDFPVPSDEVGALSEAAETPAANFDACEAAALAAGGFFVEFDRHALAYVPGKGAAADHLVVIFGNLATSRIKGDHWPWGHALLSQQGWSVLGVINKVNDWWRDGELHEAMTHLSQAGFYDGFTRITTYGSSMGGYGAIAFAPLIPMAHAVVFAPQSSLDPQIVPFETRFPYGRSLGDWGLPGSDAAQGLAALASAQIFYDPFVPKDAAHVARLTGPHVTCHKLRHFGHAIPPLLLRMGVLKPIALRATNGTLNARDLARQLRARRDLPRYHEFLLEDALAAGHFDLGIRAIDHTRRHIVDHWRIKYIRKKLRTAREDAKAATAGRLRRA